MSARKNQKELLTGGIALKNRYLGAAIGVAFLTTAVSAEAAVHRVHPGESIQAAIDAAKPGDTILIEPGEYREVGNGRYGLRISTDKLRLIGLARRKGRWGKIQRVRLIKNEDQETGVLAAPAGCEYDFNEEECAAARNETEITFLKDFYIRGLSVEEFPVNGIQTRWVEGFKFVGNKSVNNLNNGIYPTLSANGLVRNNESYGSLDTAMWIAGSENVRVIGNRLHSSVIGFEITVSNNVKVLANKMYNNNIGVGLFHPDAAGNPPIETMENWVIKNNWIVDNNGGAEAPPGSFQSLVPIGAGVLVLGVSNHEISGNVVKDNGYAGIAVLGWCTSLFGTGRDCTAPETDPLRPREASNNDIKFNYLKNNGGDAEQDPPADLTQDLSYFHLADLDPNFSALEPSGTGNCFKGNFTRRGNELSFFSSYQFDPSQLNGVLPDDGC